MVSAISAWAMMQTPEMTEPEQAAQALRMAEELRAVVLLVTTALEALAQAGLDPIIVNRDVRGCFRLRAWLVPVSILRMQKSHNRMFPLC
jgi:hypothetical protein